MDADFAFAMIYCGIGLVAARHLGGSPREREICGVLGAVLLLLGVFVLGVLDLCGLW